MDINTRKTQLVQGLTLVAAGSAIAHGYKFGPEEMEKIAQPLVEESIARFVIDFQQQQKPEVNEEQLYRELYDTAAKNIIMAAGWVAQEVPASQTLTQGTIRHIVHKRVAGLNQAEYLALKSFFPFGKYRE